MFVLTTLAVANLAVTTLDVTTLAVTTGMSESVSKFLLNETISNGA